MIYTIGIIIYIIISAIITIRLLLNGMRPTKILGWLFAIFTIPIGGIFLYFMLGRNRRKNKLFRLKKTPRVAAFMERAVAECAPISTKEFNEHHKIISLITQNSLFRPSTGNEVKLLKNGRTTFEAIFEAIKNANKFIYLEYYIFEEGGLTTELFNLFNTKINDGVDIYILYDGIGSLSLSKAYIKKLQNIGVKIHKFLPIQFGKFLSSINYRNHRKIIVIDGEIGFTGGINIADKYIKGDPNLGIWYDTHLQLKGPSVNNLKAIFALDWYLVSNDESILNTSYFSKNLVNGNSTVQIVHSGPDDNFPATKQMYFSIINEAKDYVYIANPYIIPGESILDALKVAALSGVDVRLLLSQKSDNLIVKWCVRSYFENLLQAGVKIYLFEDGFLHSKTIVSDDTISSVGTTNLDIRSFEQNYEVNAVIYDNYFAIQLREDFLEDCHKSTLLAYDTFVTRPWSHKIKEGIAKIFSPVL